MDPSAAADENLPEDKELDVLLSALHHQMESLMTLAKASMAFAEGETERSRKVRKARGRRA